MIQKHIVALTRRLPLACEERIAKTYTLRLGDDAVVYTPEILAQHAAGAAAVLVTPGEPITAAVIAALPTTVRVISSNSVGFEHIDLEAAQTRGLRVTNTPGVLTDATADIALLLILAATRRASEAERMVRNATWKGLRPTHFLGTQITHKRLGILGMGRIGAATARRAQACGMKIIYHNRKPSPDAPEDCVFMPSLDELLTQSDVLSLHCPLTPATKNILNAERIARLPRGSVVINTARGGLVEDEALIGALKSGHVFAAGLDVYANEPALDARYRSLENVFLLPHIGSATIETRTAMGMLAIDNIDAVLSGREPPHPVV